MTLTREKKDSILKRERIVKKLNSFTGKTRKFYFLSSISLIIGVFMLVISLWLPEPYLTIVKVTIILDLLLTGTFFFLYEFYKHGEKKFVDENQLEVEKIKLSRLKVEMEMLEYNIRELESCNELVIDRDNVNY